MYDEFVEILSVVGSSYDFFAGTRSEKDTKVWFGFLGDIDKALLLRAVKAWVSVEKKPPTIADIKNYVYNLKHGETWETAWAIVQHAVKKWGNSLETVNYVRSKSDVGFRTMKIIGLWSICNEENLGVLRAQFRDIYISQARRKRYGMVEGVPALDGGTHKALKGGCYEES